MHGPARVGMKRSVCRVYCVLQRPHFFAPQRPPLRRGGTSPLLPAFRQPFTASLQFFSSAAPQPTATPSVPPPTARRPAAYPALVSFLSTQPSDTHSLAAALAAHCKPGDVLLLYGGVGEGKTELARGFLRAYTGVGSLLVTSPTYTVMLEYAHAGHRVHHIDLHRLDKPGDLDILPLQQIFRQDVSLIEWPERLTEVPPHALSVRLEKLANDRLRVHHSRVITLSAHTEPWRARIEQWKAQGLPGLTIHTTPPR